MNALVPAVNPDDIASLPANQRGAVITQALTESKSWLAVATQATDPTPIAEFKAWAATVAEMTRQKGLAEEIQLDALEMVRRAERGIGVTIRNGQEAGEIRNQGERPVPGNSSKSPVSGFGLRTDELAEGPYVFADGVADDEFEEALGEAREEKNLSRANVVRKVRGIAGPLTTTEKLARIREMAREGHTSRQIAPTLGISDQRVRWLARQHEIDISADRVTSRTRQIDPERVVRATVETLQGVEFGLNLLTEDDYDAFTPEQVRAWIGALNEPARAIKALLRELNRRV